ncbi:MAG: TonB-dependent receptor [Novosphingobium sp.]|uniref:TonB-dependent receptor n=1 Tax=Novosphingobium sp. TaxID=1874826 RepID=UPI0027348C9D|nr:TonB-dependent receptor [Novosphingobium sp.]MDP3549482.1 TonB-dependent receptor [Novosphingobium sp.]
MLTHRASARLLARTSIVAAAAFAIAQPAFAQDAAQQAADEGVGTEIIVTAQKRAQSLSDVSLSVSAVGTEALAANNTVTLEGLQALVPSISFGNDFNFAKLFIRGIGLSSSLPGVDPSVALHVDGVVVSLAQAQLGSMFDLERVEVLRGPQGTLYGRNATGGAVNLITAKPSDTLEGYVRQTLGGDALLIQTDAAIGGPIAEGVRGRLAVQRIKRDGFGVNEFTGNEIDNLNQWSGRAHLEFLPSDSVNILLTGEYHREDDRSLAIKFREVSFPGVLNDTVAANDGLSALGQRLNADGSQARFATNPRNIATNFDPINDREQWALTGAITVDASDAITLKSLTSYRSFDAIFFHDFDMSTYLGYPLAQTNALRSSANHWQPVFQHQFSQELQANVDTDKFHGVFGLFYLDEQIEVENHIGLDVLTNTDPFRVQFDGRLDVKTWAAFANMTYDLSDKFSVKAGARYSWEERRLRNQAGLGSAALNRLVLDPLQWDATKSWDDFSPSLGFEFRPNDDLMLYGNWSRGFKSGTAEIGSTRKLSATQASPFVDPEKVEAFEVGSKYSAGALSANLAVFFQRLKNGQFSLTRAIPTPPFFTSTLTNAAVSEAYGAEFDVLWRPSREFTVNASVGYLHSEFTKFSASDPLDPRLFAPGAVESQLIKDLSGNATRMSPKWSLNLNPTYSVGMNNGGEVQFGSNFSYRSKQFHTEFNDDRMAQDGYIQLDANIRYKHSDGHFSANAWVRNITNELVYAGSFAVSTSRAIGGTLMPPRTYGITLGYDF